MDPARARLVKEGQPGEGPAVYWMSRDQRALDNPALLFAQELAMNGNRPLVVAFSLSPSFLGAARRQYAFMLHGLKDVEKDLAESDMQFHLVPGGPSGLSRHLKGMDPLVVVEDFDPLRVKREWKGQVRASVRAPFWEVDAHNVVPCWKASPKQEWAARTFRPKLAAQLDRYLTDLPRTAQHPFFHRYDAPGWSVDEILGTLKVDHAVREVEICPGRRAAENALKDFIEYRIEHYPEDRNDPNRNGQSGLSPYLHFGTLSPQRAAWEVHRSDATMESKAAFLEELIVRRELSDNFCHYNKDYDRYKGLPEWSRRTLERHMVDRRETIYTMAELTAGETEDDLWNAMQRDMVRHGKMHGYLRMYWAKKLLEWSETPQEAIERAIQLNDHFELDGRDPNGYVGILWSIGGLHDRPWKERPIFGTVRYMSHAGMARKFDTAVYEHRNLEGIRR